MTLPNNISHKNRLSWRKAEDKEEFKYILIPRQLRDHMDNSAIYNWFYTLILQFVRYSEQYNKNVYFMTVDVPDQFTDLLGKKCTLHLDNGKYFMTF